MINISGRSSGDVPGITRLDEGNTWRVEEKMTIKINPVTNSGNEIATSDKTLTV
tara:strand:+ start:1475 stop:1636 length:162 start_codon:yes stop_codon:yes gene_type:complete